MKITIKYEYNPMYPSYVRYTAKAYNGSVFLGLNCRESFEAAKVAVIQYVKDTKYAEVVPPPEEVEVAL